MDKQREIISHEKQTRDQYRMTFVATLISAIKRIMRCVLAYLNHRIKKIREAFWDSGMVFSQDKLDLMSPEERTFYLDYKKANLEYQNSFPIEMDLTKDLEPPTSIYIEIRVLADCGEVMNSDGDTIKLDRGATEFVRKSDVEHLLKQGLVVPTSSF